MGGAAAAVVRSAGRGRLGPERRQRLRPARCRYERLRCSYEPARPPARSAFTARRERAEQSSRQASAWPEASERERAGMGWEKGRASERTSERA